MIMVADADAARYPIYRSFGDVRPTADVLAPVDADRRS
jgi:hypothetical protein